MKAKPTPFEHKASRIVGMSERKPTPVQAHVLRRMREDGWTLEVRGQSWWLCDGRKQPRKCVDQRTMVSLVRGAWIAETGRNSWKLTAAGKLL